MVRQVRLKAVNTDASGNVTTKRVFAFGTHPLAAPTDYPALGANSMPTIAATSQQLRIIVDELLVGNYLEEIACRGPLDSAGTAYDQVPVGATPEDIAKCSAAKDVLTTQCPGSMEHAVCLCHDDAGCGGVAKGDPVGVLDVNQDGAADDTRMINGAAGIRCGTIDVPMDTNASYWNPSGDQNKPAMGGFDALGPAVVLVPSGALPTNSDCLLSFAPNVVDKQNNQVCVPKDGDVANDCTPGDLSAFQFKVEALRLTNQSFGPNAMGVDRSAPVLIVANAGLTMSTLAPSVSVTENGTAFTGYTLSLPLPTSIKITWNAPLTPSTPYTITVNTMLTDTYGQPLPQTVTYMFTTGT